MDIDLTADCDAADLERAAELVRIAMTEGVDSDAYHQKLRLIVSEYEFPQMMLAMFHVLANAPSIVLCGPQVVSDQIDITNGIYQKRWPAKDKMPEAVMAELDTKEI